jgi:hypothetical protein
VHTDTNLGQRAGDRVPASARDRQQHVAGGHDVAD